MVLVYLKFGPSIKTLIFAITLAALITITAIDIEHQIIPDSITLPGIIFGIIAGIYLNGIRQTEGINYKTTSDHSLLNSQVRIEPQDSILYGNGSGFFNFTGFTPIF